MYSITAAFLLSSPCVAHRIARDFNGADLAVEADTSVDVDTLVAEPLQTMHSMPQGAGNAVDWDFMTPTFSWAGRDQDTYDTVQGHACQANGRYDQSYYATSLCYWHPETEHVAPQHWGLNWHGGYGSTEFCGGLGLQSGVCARCSVCHDNSRDRDAQVDSARAHVEILPLPDCMKEGAIEASCNHQFEAENNELLAEESRCREVLGRHEEAVANFNTVNDAITGSEASITQLVHNIAHGYPQEAHCGMPTIQSIRQVAVRDCHRFGIRDHHDDSQMMNRMPRCELPSTFVKLANGVARCEPGTEITDAQECAQAVTALGFTPTAPISSQYNPPDCSVADSGQMRFNTNSRGRSHERMAPVCKVAIENENNATHRRCERCTGHMDTLQTAVQESHSAHAELEAWQASLVQHEQNIANHRTILAQSYQEVPARSQRKAQMEGEWLPQQGHCQEVFGSVVSARNSNMMGCAPRFYDQSCEKACVEIQRTGEHGCGVVEGSEYGDAFERGGVEVTCSPPAPSWIMSPSNYGGSAQPNSGEQCGRMNAEQSARMTTPVMKSDWLTIPGNGGWFSSDERKFYVLESGNGVRSANLRKFDGALPDGTEETNDGIIMWDAEEVSATETSGERACFEIKHRYDGRTTRWQRRGITTTYCVTGSGISTTSRIRDEWVSVLQGLLVWRPRVA